MSSFEADQALLRQDIERVRHFDRYYDRRLRDLQERALSLEFSWLQLMVVRELGQAREPRARRKLIRAMRSIENIMSRGVLDNLKERWLGARKRAPYLKSRAASGRNRPSART